MNYKKVLSEITFLRMLKHPKSFLDTRIDILLEEIENPIDANEYRKLYKSVGESLNWLDRIFMPDDKLSEEINDSNTHVYIFKIENNYAGYCELIDSNEYVEILYFGLIPEFVGKGYGNYLLNKTIEKAWSFNKNWIQLNTCDLDHPNALATYIKAGFEPYKTIKEEKIVK